MIHHTCLRKAGNGWPSRPWVEDIVGAKGKTHSCSWQAQVVPWIHPPLCQLSYSFGYANPPASLAVYLSSHWWNVRKKKNGICNFYSPLHAIVGASREHRAWPEVSRTVGLACDFLLLNLCPADLCGKEASALQESLGTLLWWLFLTLLNVFNLSIRT